MPTVRTFPPERKTPIFPIMLSELLALIELEWRDRRIGSLPIESRYRRLMTQAHMALAQLLEMEKAA